MGTNDGKEVALTDLFQCRAMIEEQRIDWHNFDEAPAQATVLIDLVGPRQCAQPAVAEELVGGALCLVIEDHRQANDLARESWLSDDGLGCRYRPACGCRLSRRERQRCRGRWNRFACGLNEFPIGGASNRDLWVAAGRGDKRDNNCCHERRAR